MEVCMLIERNNAVKKVYGWGGWKMTISHPVDSEHRERGVAADQPLPNMTR